MTRVWGGGGLRNTLTLVNSSKFEVLTFRTQNSSKNNATARLMYYEYIRLRGNCKKIIHRVDISYTYHKEKCVKDYSLQIWQEYLNKPPQLL